MKKSAKSLLTLMLCLLASLTASAYDFESGGIYYNITNTSKKTVEVTYNYTSYSGRVNIPSSVSYTGNTYSVTSIGESAFSWCGSLTSVTIPNSVTSIGNRAFYYCDGLTSVTIPNSVTSIGKGSFAVGEDGKLQSIEVASDNKNYTSDNGILFTKDMKTLVQYPAGKSGSYSIPNSVTSIGEYAFYYCYGLTSVTIPNSVTSIGESAFYHCDGLTSVTIPNSVTSIGKGSFAVGEDGKLQSIEVASDNKNYTSDNGILFTKDMKTLVQYPAGKSGSYSIPNSVTSIGEEAFYNCDGLTSVAIPNSVTSIGGFAFYNCDGLTSVAIPNSVTSIGGFAFYYCDGLNTVYCNATTPPSIDSNTFYRPSSVTLHVPTGWSDKYRNAQYWSDFNNIVDDIIIPSSGIYLGVIGFNRELYEKPIGLLNENNVKTYTDFVNTFENSLRNTLLYYSVDYALDRIIEPVYPENLTNAIIITFTDGLDKGSLVERPELMKDEDYVELLKNKIANTKVQGLDLQTYSLGVKGNDVTNTVLFNTNLSSLASKPEYANMLENIDDLDRKFNDIYKELETQTMQRTISISVPVMSNQQVCRFTLDGTSDNSKVNNSRIWVEGTYDRKTLELKNVSYKGFTSSSGSTVQGITDPNNRYNVVFTFNDCKDPEGNILNIEDKNDINQWLLIEDSNEWQPNSEMVQDEDIDIEVTKTSAVIMLLLDSSYSLGVEDFAKIKSQANAFIERLAGVNGEQNGVEDVCADRTDDVVDWSGAECYNLQGVRIDNPVTGLYIQRVGNHSRKIFVR